MAFSSRATVVLAVLVVVVMCATTVVAKGKARSKPLPTGTIDLTEKLIDSRLTDIQWTDKNTVFVLTENGQVYRSADQGKSFHHISAELHSMESEPRVRSMHISPADKNVVFLLGTDHESWYSSDMGHTFVVTGHSLKISEVKLHPSQSHWLLAEALSEGCHTHESDCFKSLYVSRDLGENWDHLRDYVVQFDWAPRGMNDHTIFATLHEHESGNQKFGSWDPEVHFVRSDDFFKDFDIEVLHGNRFIFSGDFLFVAAVDPTSHEEVALLVTKDRGSKLHYTRAELPVDLKEHSYTILDATEGRAFLHVYHRPLSHSHVPVGHVYISDASGTRFSLSLPYNVRNADGKCDFEKVEGLEAAYLANFVDVAHREDENEEEAIEDWDDLQQAEAKLEQGHVRIKSVVTHDKGAVWKFLQPPTVDAHGKKLEHCEHCHLHLHGVSNMFGPFYSTANSIGLVMGTGNIGKYLETDRSSLNTYLSRDGGHTWHEVAKGSHIYEIGDHGGLVVMAYDAGETNEILYSWDQGLTWGVLHLDNKVHIENIIIEPNSTALQFIAYGTQDGHGVLLHLDFSLLHQRACHGVDAPSSAHSDYEMWNPYDEHLSGQCVLGHKISYLRRKREALCYSPEEYETKREYEHCSCTASDFECDLGYTRSAPHEDDDGVKPCLPEGGIAPPQESASTCKGDYYYITKGYRRIPGDTCVGGDEWDRVAMSCGGIFSSGNIGRFVVFLLLVGVAFIVYKTGVDNIKSQINNFWQRRKYKHLDFAPDSMIDDDFSLEDDLDNGHLLKKPSAGPALTAFDSPKKSIPANSSMHQQLPNVVSRNVSVPILSPPNESP